MKIEHAIEKIGREYGRATKLFPPFNSNHEGKAAIEEEYDELWDLIKAHKNPFEATPEMEWEAVQIGAMALRFLVDRC